VLLASLLGGVQSASASTATTATATLTPGPLSITAARSSFFYPTTALTGAEFNLASSFALSVNDATGSGAGWSLAASADAFTDLVGNTIPAQNHTIQGALAETVTGTGPTNNITYPMQIPSTNLKIYSANANTGRGQSTETFLTQLTAPADAFAGTYTTLLTISLVSGP
jgi:hypothetical protein